MPKRVEEANFPLPAWGKYELFSNEIRPDIYQEIYSRLKLCGPAIPAAINFPKYFREYYPKQLRRDRYPADFPASILFSIAHDPRFSGDLSLSETIGISYLYQHAVSLFDWISRNSDRFRVHCLNRRLVWDDVKNALHLPHGHCRPVDVVHGFSCFGDMLVTAAAIRRTGNLPKETLDEWSIGREGKREVVASWWNNCQAALLADGGEFGPNTIDWVKRSPGQFDYFIPQTSPRYGKSGVQHGALVAARLYEQVMTAAKSDARLQV